MLIHIYYEEDMYYIKGLISMSILLCRYIQIVIPDIKDFSLLPKMFIFPLFKQNFI